MSSYRVHNVVIRKSDRSRAETILEKHWMMGDIDAITSSDLSGSNGDTLVSYWIAPYICEDLRIIVDEFKRTGIHVM